MSFQALWENMKLSREKEIPIEDSALTVIRSGNNLDEDFWNNFKLVVNNSDGLSKLLDVPVEKISTWREKIDKAIKKVQELDGDVKLKKNKKILKPDAPEIEEQP